MMTNPYEDLFKKAEPPKEASHADDVPPATPVIPPPVPSAADPVDLLEQPESGRRLGWILIAIYVAGLVLSTLVEVGLFWYLYPSQQTILDNIVDVQIDYNVTPSDLYEGYPYAISVTGRFENHNDVTLGSIYATFTFYDENGDVIAGQTYSEDNVVAGGALSVDDILYVDADVFSADYEWGYDMSSLFYILVNTLSSAILATIFLIVDKRQFRDRWSRFKKDWRAGFASIITGAVLMYLALFASSYLMDWLGITGTSNNEATIASFFQPEPLRLVVLFLMLCVLTPIVEETVFRRALINLFPKRFGAVLPIVVSGIIFGFMHVSSGDFAQVIPYVALGLVLGGVYWFSGKNIYVTIAVHGINNLLSFLIYVAALYGFTGI
jgi:membrane protease YdiL (CAAX protease family)